MSEEITLTDGNFEQEVLKSDMPVLVDFWAEWCGPCKMLGPIITELAREYAGRAKVGKLNVDQNPAISERYGIRGIPTLILFRSGKASDQVVGAQSKEKIKELIDKNI